MYTLHPVPVHIVGTVTVSRDFWDWFGLLAALVAIVALVIAVYAVRRANRIAAASDVAMVRERQLTFELEVLLKTRRMLASGQVSFAGTAQPSWTSCWRPSGSGERRSVRRPSFSGSRPGRISAGERSSAGARTTASQPPREI